MAVQQRDISEEEVFDDVETASADDSAEESGQERFAADTSGKTPGSSSMLWEHVNQ